MRGNKRSLKHGVFAQVASAEDVANELALLAVAFPHLDPIADGRLIELLATARVSVARSYLALAEPEGIRSSVVTGFASRQMALAERLERQVFDRDRIRAADASRAPGTDPLAKYRASEPA